MDTRWRTKKVSFCCPQHGALLRAVEYFSLDIGNKRLADVPLVYCEDCKKYYTPFANLLAFVSPQNIQHKGCLVVAGKGHVEKSFPKVKVRTPYFVDMQGGKVLEDQHSSKKVRVITHEEKVQEERLRLEKARIRIKQERLRKEQFMKYIEGLREVSYNAPILTNKPCFTKESLCPRCKKPTKKENVKIVQYEKFLLDSIRYCEYCKDYYISPKQIYAIEKKASRKIYGEAFHPFVRPQNVECEYQGEQDLFIPKSAIDFDKFSQYVLPPRGDGDYDMTDEEYMWVKTLYQPEEFSVPLREKSFLAEAGYSTSESEIRRRNILAKCVSEHGKSRVIDQLKTNINLRTRQKDGNVRYANALNIWRGDIWYIENML